jgi:Rad3-related DNA helicase
MPHVLNLSVHDIVDVILRRGHLDTRIFNQSSMQEGTRLHALYQKEQQDGYIAEYSLSKTFYQEDYVYVVSGKADGVIIDNEGNITVEEIKTTVADLDEFIHDHGQWHLGQAMFYAYIIGKDKNANQVDILMTYLRQQNYKMSKQIRQTYKMEDLEMFVSDVILRFTNYQKKIQRFKEIRDESIKNLPFPFTSYRAGQKEMMDFVSRAADDHQEVYIEAPTGIGKTLSVLYPLVSRFGQHKADRIFYLTSKNSIKKIAMSALDMFKMSGAKCKSIEFTSQENICFNDKKGHCNPDECPFARHYYDKLMDAVFDALELEDTFDRKAIEDICYRRDMCPFQFQLDLSYYCDVLVCDYTYVYDYHDRLGLSEGSIARTHTYLCVDECHNLPDRVRDMYSIEIEKKSFEDAISLCGPSEFASLKTDIKDAIKMMEKIEIDPDDPELQKEGVFVLKQLPDDFVLDLYDIITDMKAILKKHALLVSDELLEFFYAVNSFYYLATLVNDEELGSSFLSYVRVNRDNEITSIRIANLNSRPLIKQAADYFESVVYFSATLSPKEYYLDLLGGSLKENNHLFLPSPFPLENRRVFVDYRLSLRYKDRDQTLYQVFSLCRTAMETKTGNYFIFCPSFEYLERMASFFDQEPLENSRVIIQGRGMREDQREEFLEQFKSDNDETLIGLLVLGGVFSEGIDLLGDRLIGAMIISVGIPQITFERNHLKDYYDAEDEEGHKGFSYAYSYPGVNRVLQAGGRVIRSEEDKGFILYIDSRFHSSLYQKIFAELYPDMKRVISNSQVRTQLKLFWKETK